VTATFALDDLRDTAAAVERTRRMLDADCDPVAVADAFAGDPLVGPLVRGNPGLRVPGHVDGNEIAVRAVLGQQVSVAGARTVAARLVRAHGRGLGDKIAQAAGLTHLFPDAATIAALDPGELPMPRARGRALIALCGALADGAIALDRGPDRDQVRHALLDIPGIGPWTADYVALRALGHPDVFLPTDIGIRDALTALGRDPREAARLAEGWRPWRSYAQMHLWQTLVPRDGATREGDN
jgi:AraC family transcriptional regulator of adaptative response / DNA-3-methyladenine glycosylase II